ncbi:MAG TPA: response regulator transcription factor [Gaiellaceae bacterium]|jgi:two-component system response regulator DegU|nr:response regulator transcription factor [Gaiellaceae bacterium]
MRPLKVLLADDHRLILEATRLVLEQADDIEIVGEATTGSQVLPLVARTSPDLVLLDIRMPEMDGLTCLDRIRKAHPNVMVVILSGCDDPETVSAALARGARSFIGKLVDPRDLPSALRLVAQGAVYNAVGSVATPREAEAESAGLTPSEQRVLEALARGLSNKEIAQELWLTPQTVKFHLTNIYRRLGVANRTEAVRHAYQHRLVKHPFFEPAT